MSTGVQLKIASKLSIVIWLTNKHADCHMTFKLYCITPPNNVNGIRRTRFVVVVFFAFSIPFVFLNLP